MAGCEWRWRRERTVIWAVFSLGPVRRRLFNNPIHHAEEYFFIFKKSSRFLCGCSAHFSTRWQLCFWEMICKFSAILYMWTLWMNEVIKGEVSCELSWTSPAFSVFSCSHSMHSVCWTTPASSHCFTLLCNDGSKCLPVSRCVSGLIPAALNSRLFRLMSQMGLEYNCQKTKIQIFFVNYSNYFTKY